MASLDKIEGELIEGGILILIVVFAVIFWGLYKTLGNPLEAAKQAWSRLLNLLLGAWQNVKAGANTPVSQYGGLADAEVKTGSANFGAGNDKPVTLDEMWAFQETLNQVESGQLGGGY
jgi:hypothetical protein